MMMATRCVSRMMMAATMVMMGALLLAAWECAIDGCQVGKRQRHIELFSCIDGHGPFGHHDFTFLATMKGVVGITDACHRLCVHRKKASRSIGDIGSKAIIIGIVGDALKRNH